MSIVDALVRAGVKIFAHADGPDISPGDMAGIEDATSEDRGRFVALSETDEKRFEIVDAPAGGGSTAGSDVVLTEIHSQSVTFASTRSDFFVELTLDLADLPAFCYLHVDPPDGTGDYILLRRSDIEGRTAASAGDRRSAATSILFPDAVGSGDDFYLGRNSAGKVMVAVANKSAYQGATETVRFFRGGAQSTFGPQKLSDQTYSWDGGTGAISILAGESGTAQLVCPETGFLIIGLSGGPFVGDMVWRGAADLRAATSSAPINVVHPGTFTAWNLFTDSGNKVYLQAGTGGTAASIKVTIWTIG